jgi:hypothetical protein
VTAIDERDRLVRGFVRRTYGLRGTLALHRHALGWDLVRAPLNVVLAPVFMLVRLFALLAGKLGWRKVSGWLMGRRILLETDVSQAVAGRLHAFLADLRARGLSPELPAAQVERAVMAHVQLRNAVAEIAVMLTLLATGALLFHMATPGVISLAGPVADLRAAAEAVADFPLGRPLGRLYYGLFPVSAGVGQVVITGIALAALTALATTFAGVVTDPLQRLLGVHRRRLERLLDQIDRNAETGGLEKEHVVARLGDLSDMAVNLWRMFRG